MTNWEEKEVCLSSTLEQISKKCSPQEREAIADVLLALLKGYELAREEVPETPVQTALRLHTAADMLLAKKDATKEAITCRKGCAHCCHMNVTILPEEADLLLEVGLRKNIKINPERLLKQVKWKEDDDWLKQPKEDRRCVFLGPNDECQVYEDRPLACRKFFVISEPELCNIDKHPGRDVAIWYDTMVEIISSAAMTFYSVDTLPRQLLRAMARTAGWVAEKEGASGTA